ncbi:SufD family Fe-S cluster assembly protein [Arcobacter sp. LA11]|uniref:SufD family Fe-S cluster assembly protein n=1 Tax=Arcobacter sp. LA11 TaxID=1898176 RepID=UPI000932979D|nr:SufD family Fe-S cluster assembly protein [Arcobacter sp. LA11]
MKLIDLKNIKFPTKKDEEFRKIDLSSLYEYSFKDKKDYVINLDLGQKNKVSSTNNELYKINQNLDSKNYELIIKEDTKEPIVVVHVLKDDDIINTNTLHIKVEKGIKASIIEVFLSNCKNTFYSVNREFEIKDNANLNYFKYQDIKESNKLIINSIIDLKNNANIEHTSFELGDGFNLNIYETSLDNIESSLNINGLVRLYKEAHSSSIFNTLHNNKSSFSNVNYKHSLHDNSKAVFEAKSIVNENANFSKVLQNSNTILLSDDATIFAKPHLEISIDELEASHGATVGSLNKDQLLYLRSRGIEENKAFDMLLKAFENEIYDNIKDEKIKRFIANFKRSDYV